MLDSMYIGATGMHAQQMNVDAVANNLANVNTVGYKRSRVSFVDLMARDTALRSTGSDAPSLTGLDELFTRVPLPADVSSSLVLITGPSRTADIEQILVRGVHGPGQLTVVIVG